MADGPTVVTSGNGGTAVAVIIAIIALAIVLFATGVIDFEGGVDRNVNVDVDTPAVETPTVPAPTIPAPTASEPAAPAPEAPAPAAPAPAAPAPANDG
jgi:hypothetical protein